MWNAEIDPGSVRELERGQQLILICGLPEFGSGSLAGNSRPKLLPLDIRCTLLQALESLLRLAIETARVVQQPRFAPMHPQAVLRTRIGCSVSIWPRCLQVGRPTCRGRGCESL